MLRPQSELGGCSALGIARISAGNSLRIADRERQNASDLKVASRSVRSSSATSSGTAACHTPCLKKWQERDYQR